MRPKREIRRANEFAYFISTQTAEGMLFFRHERWARLMVETLVHYSESKFILHAYVVMPDHLHFLISPTDSLEKAVQLVKGGISFRATRELNWGGEIWQPGFTDHRIRDKEDWQEHLEYIRQNPVRALLANEPVLYPYMNFPNAYFPQGLKPSDLSAHDVRAGAATLQRRTRGDSTQGLKPSTSTDIDVRAEARTLQVR